MNPFELMVDQYFPMQDDASEDEEEVNYLYDCTVVGPMFGLDVTNVITEYMTSMTEYDRDRETVLVLAGFYVKSSLGDTFKHPPQFHPVRDQCLSDFLFEKMAVQFVNLFASITPIVGLTPMDRRLIRKEVATCLADSGYYYSPDDHAFRLGVRPDGWNPTPAWMVKTRQRRK